MRQLFQITAFATLLTLSLDLRGNNLLNGDTSFETGPGKFIVSSWNQAIKWETDSATAFDGKQSVKLKYERGDWTQNTPLEITPELAGKKFTFSIYAKADQDGIPGRLYMIQPGFTHACHGNIFTFTKDWKRYSVTGELKQGYYWLGISAQKPCTIWGDAIQLEEGIKASAYKNNSGTFVNISIPHNNNYIFFREEKFPIQISTLETVQENKTGSRILSLEITDWQGKKVFSKETEFEINKTPSLLTYDYAPEKVGWFKITANIKANGKIAATANTAFCTVEAPVEIQKGEKPFCGIVGHPSEGMLRIGSRWNEKIFKWKEIEPEPGKYKWPSISRHNRLKYKFTIAPFHGIPEWAWDEKDVEESKSMKIKPRFGYLPSAQRLENWKKFIHEFASRYKDQMDILEIGAEDDLTFGQNPYYLKKYPECAKNGKLISGPAYERYVEILKIACEEIRKAAPAVKIAIVRSSGLDCNFSSNAVKECKDFFDLLPLDCYTWPRNLGPGQAETAVPEDYLPRILQEAENLCKTGAKGQHAYISEIGYAMDYTVEPDSIYAKEMVKRLSRMHLVAKMTPNVERLDWFIDGDSCVEAGKYHYGVWRFGTPLPSAAAYSAVARIVENVKGSQELILGGDSKAVVFEKNGRADAAVWFVRGDGRLKFQDIPMDIVISDVMGNPLQLEKPSFPSNILCAIGLSNNPTILNIGEFPVYFSLGGNNTFEKLVNILSRSEMICKPVKISFTTPRNDKGILRVQNISGKDIEAILKVNQSVKNLSLKKGKATAIEVALDKNPIDISVNCGNGYEKVNASYPISFESCPRIDFKGKINADLSKWNGRPFIAMNDRSQIMPPDPWIDYKGPEQFSAKVYTGWDDKYFYMAAEVKDEIHSNNYAYGIYKSDCIQFAFDPLANAEKAGYDKDDQELGIALVDNKVVVGQWAGNGNVWGNAEYAVRRNDKEKKTFYEMRIPLASLGIAPEKGRAFGFNFVIFNDDTGAGANYYYQFAPGITNGKNPALFKKFYLQN